MYISSPSLRCRISTPASRTKPNITRSLFSSYNLSFKGKVIGYVEELKQQKENATVQKAILDKLNALVSVPSEPVQFIPMNCNKESPVPDMNFEPAEPCEEMLDMCDA